MDNSPQKIRWIEDSSRPLRGQPPASKTVQLQLHFWDRNHKYFGNFRMPVGSEHETFRHPLTREVVIVSKAVALSASYCTHFAALGDHVSHLSSLGIFEQVPVDLILNQLSAAVSSGLLLSIADIREHFIRNMRLSAEGHVIDIIGIPTRDRPEQLRLLLSDLAANLSHKGSKIDIAVLDDSRSHEMQAMNRAVLATACRIEGVTIRYANLQARRAYVSRLANASGIPRDLLAFALLGDGYSLTTGACRNTLLLESTGQRILFLDDDVRCQIAPVPGSTKDVVFGRARDSFVGSFFADESDLVGCGTGPDNPLESHDSVFRIDSNFIRQTLAGNCPLRGGKVDFSSLTPTLLEKLGTGNSAVTISSMGLLGAR